MKTDDMTRNAHALLVFMVTLSAVIGVQLAVSGYGMAWQWLHWICKPLATALIFCVAWRAQPTLSTHYRRWILCGIACSLVGDVLLMLPQNLFVPGLIAFLFGHLCFLGAFLGDSRFAARPWLLLTSLGYGAINLCFLWSSIATALRMPVLVYVLVLACMAGQAMVRARVLAQSHDAQARRAGLAAAGALMFMLSDSVLAWNRFHAPIPWANVWVLSTYYLALYWIACSVQRDGLSTNTSAVQ